MPILLAKKTDGRLDLRIDYRVLNKNNIVDLHRLPYIDELPSRLWAAKYFSRLDLHNRYFHIPKA